jgi:hypothetical protein
MKQLFLIFLAASSSFAFSQDAVEYKYEPEVNKAEYYIGSYNKNKDLDDLVDWYGDFAEWTNKQGNTYDSMTVGLLTPYFHNDMAAADVMWVNTWPSPLEQFEGLETWMTKGGAKLLESLPVTNSQVVDTFQWIISEPSSMDAGNMMYATYAQCSLEEGYTMRKVYDLYKDFAMYAASQGDTVGRKMIVPDAGHALPDGVDFVRLMWTSSISERGVNADIYYNKLADSEPSQNLKGFSCSNANSYVGLSMRAAK